VPPQVTSKTLVGLFGFSAAEVARYNDSIPEARRLVMVESAASPKAQLSVSLVATI